MPTVGVFAAIFDAQGRILCVRQGYGARKWTLPGGRMERGETPHEALVREVREETSFEVAPGDLIGVYSTPYKDALVLAFRATSLGRGLWHPTDEIDELGFFARDALPVPMRHHTLVRIQDAFAGAAGVVRTIGRESARKVSVRRAG